MIERQLTVDEESAEFYPTPAWAVQRFLEHPAIERLRLILESSWWFDPCVGEGAIVEAVNANYGHGYYGAASHGNLPTWAGCDIRETEWIRKNGGHYFAVCDYLTMPMRPVANASILNPPFSKAAEFARTAKTHSRYVFMLQRRNWLTSCIKPSAPQETKDWIKANPPTEFLLPDRPSFTGNGTDSQEYEWYAWGIGPGLYFLNETPLDVRKTHAGPRLTSAQGGLNFGADGARGGR